MFEGHVYRRLFGKASCDYNVETVLHSEDDLYNSRIAFDAVEVDDSSSTARIPQFAARFAGPVTTTSWILASQQNICFPSRPVCIGAYAAPPRSPVLSFGSLGLSFSLWQDLSSSFLRLAGPYYPARKRSLKTTHDEKCVLLRVPRIYSDAFVKSFILHGANYCLRKKKIIVYQFYRFLYDNRTNKLITLYSCKFKTYYYIMYITITYYIISQLIAIIYYN